MTFTVGQKVVYPNHGVCLVEEISTKSFAGNNQELFVLRLLSNNSKVMVPKENLDLVGLRPLCSQSEIETLFGILENGDIDTYKDWKGRYKQNLDKMKTGQLTEVAEVLKNLCLVSQKKSLSFREKKMYERAKFFIVSEVAHVKEVSEAESEQLVEGLLEASLQKLRERLEEEREAKARKEAKAKEARRAGKASDAPTEAEETAEPALGDAEETAKTAQPVDQPSAVEAGPTSERTTREAASGKRQEDSVPDDEDEIATESFDKESALEVSVA